MIGRRVGDYVVTRLLGEGGMGAVYAARHHDPDLEEIRAIKFLQSSMARDEAMLRRFKTEAMAASRLKHDNIIRLDTFSKLDDGTPFIVMEWLDGIALDRFLAERQRILIHQALHIVCQVGAALKAAHDRSIVHRDLKPANVFLIHNPRNPHHIKLLDFGIAKLWSAEFPRQTGTGMAMGTAPYMAPEQIEDASRADARADIYALGVLAYELVTGHLPYDVSLSTVQLYEKQKYVGPPPPEFVPPAWQDAIARALSFNPDDRYQTVQAFVSALASATPADAPNGDPSGAEIVQAAAPELSYIAHMPADGETLRNVGASADQMAMLLWAARLPRVGSAARPAPAQPAPAYGVVEWQRAGTVPLQKPHDKPTTLSSAAGAVAAPLLPPQPRRRNGRLVAAAVFLVIAGGAGAALVASRSSGSDRDAGADGAGMTGSEAVAMVRSDARVELASGSANLAAPPAPPVDASPADAQAIAPQKRSEAILAIVTTPAKARIRVAGSVATSRYVVRGNVGDVVRYVVELEGYRRVERTVTLEPGEATARVRLTRKEPAASGVVRGSSDPASADETDFDPDAIGGD